MWDHPLGALATYKRITTIAGCADIVSGFVNIVLSFLSSSLPLSMINVTKDRMNNLSRRHSRGENTFYKRICDWQLHFRISDA